MEYDNSKLVTWFIGVGKIPGWSFEKFHHEYRVVHAAMTKQVADHVGTLKDYTQTLVEYDFRTEKPLRDPEDNEGYEALTIHIWSSLNDVFAGFADPGYKANAGKHLFSRLDDMFGCFALNAAEVVSDAHGTTDHPKARSIVFHRKGFLGNPRGKEGEQTSAWLKSRFSMGKSHIENDHRLLRYHQHLDCTPDTVSEGFKGTLFANGEWQNFCAVEEFVFRNTIDASTFLNDNRTWVHDGQKPLIITGAAHKVFGED